MIELSAGYEHACRRNRESARAMLLESGAQIVPYGVLAPSEGFDVVRRSSVPWKRPVECHKVARSGLLPSMPQSSQRARVRFLLGASARLEQDPRVLSRIVRLARIPRLPQGLLPDNPSPESLAKARLSPCA